MWFPDTAQGISFHEIRDNVGDQLVCGKVALMVRGGYSQFYDKLWDGLFCSGLNPAPENKWDGGHAIP